MKLYFIEFRLALIQLKVGAQKQENLRRARQLVLEAAQKHKAQVVALPVSKETLLNKSMKMNELGLRNVSIRRTVPSTLRSTRNRCRMANHAWLCLPWPRKPKFI